MPDGLLQWYDARDGEGRVVRNGRQYPVVADEMESRARVPGARVHFDIDRRDGVEVATNVTLREGTRVSRRQRRFGDMVGARRPDTRGDAPFAKPHPELGRRLASRPEEVVQTWLQRVGGTDLDAALLLYAPDAVVHVGDGDRRGRAIDTWLTASELPGRIHTPDTAGAGDDVFEASWSGPDGRRSTSWMRVARGEIVEQWIAGARPPAEPEPEPEVSEPTFEVAVFDDAAATARDYAERKVQGVLSMIDDPVLHVRVKLSMARNPATERPARAQATIDVNGQPVRAQVAAGAMTEAVDLLTDRLRDQLQHRAARVEAMRRLQRVPPGTWRRGQLPTVRPPWFDRPPEERELVRRKSFALEESTVDEAAFDMDMLDADFHLFTELATGDDALLHRRSDGGYGLHRLRPSPLEAEASVVDVELDEVPAPTLPIAEALERLHMTGEPFVFYRDTDTGRGHVVYRRYDGHDGLITPADVDTGEAAGAGGVAAGLDAGSPGR